MANPFELFETDQEKQDSGIFVDYGDYRLKGRCASNENRAYHTKRMKFLRKYKMQTILDEVMNPKQRHELAEIYFDTVMLGWEGEITNREGKELEYNKENFVWLMMQLPKQFSDLRNTLGDWTNFRAHSDVEQIVEN